VIVVDASALVEVLRADPASSGVRDRLFRPGETLHAPHLIDVEVLQALRRLQRSGQVSPHRGRLAVRYLSEIPLTRYPHESMLARIWELRENATAYDAAYIALAEVLEAPLVTRDRALLSCPGHTARVELV
jgi:predicted nucleic acid-binding protein